MEEIVCLGSVIRDIPRFFHFELHHDIACHGRKEFDPKRNIVATVNVKCKIHILSLCAATPFFFTQIIPDPDANSPDVLNPKVVISADARFEKSFPRRVELVMQLIRKRRQTRTTMLQTTRQNAHARDGNGFYDMLQQQI